LAGTFTASQKNGSQDMFQTTYQLGAFVVLTFSGPWEGITKKQSFDEAKDQPEGRLEQ